VLSMWSILWKMYIFHIQVLVFLQPHP
jgi:hypothetical protein